MKLYTDKLFESRGAGMWQKKTMVDSGAHGHRRSSVEQAKE
jgi:hypothetical protein